MGILSSKMGASSLLVVVVIVKIITGRENKIVESILQKPV
jgi:hypothetical protein